MAQGFLPKSQATGQLDQRLCGEAQVHAEVGRVRRASQLLDIWIFLHAILPHRCASELRKKGNIYFTQYKYPIDTLAFDFLVIPKNSKDHDLSKTPKDGCYVHGLFLDGARWD